MQSKHNICVTQLGARMHYAVPEIFESENMLEHFYTDFTIPKKSLPGKLASIVSCKSNSISRRIINTVPQHKITQFPVFAAEYARRRKKSRTATDTTSAYLWGGQRFGELVSKKGLHNASAVYAFNSTALEIFNYAKEGGVLRVLEQTIAPRSFEEKILAEEEDRFKNWTTRREPDALVGSFIEREKEEWNVADLILCGSEFVKETIISEGGPANKIVVVPYGVNTKPDTQNKTKHDAPLRVLFAGAVGLRKGIGYLAQALEKLDTSMFTVHAVGAIQLSDQGKAEVSKNIHLQGHLSRIEMEKEYKHTDVMVLPTLCEGSATVCYEAMSRGIPVITTFNAGSTIRDQIDGFIVPIRSPEALADKLETLSKDRDMLMKMGNNARENFSHWSLSSYATNLLNAINANTKGLKQK